ncbi:MAG: heavy metal-binding protein [Pseudomonadota bacterium]|nr:heavy metal-binding protein [Pseudomonadota bacterium]
MSAQRLRITGMTCDHCARIVEDALNALPGEGAGILLPGDRRDPGFRGPQHRTTLADSERAKGFDASLLKGQL